MKTPEQIQKEIEKLLEENNCSFDVEFHFVKETNSFTDVRINIIRNKEK